MTYGEWMQRLKGGTVAVLGVGISNRPLVDFLLSHGASVVARDRMPREKLGEVAQRWESLGVRFQCGDGYLEGLEEDVIFRAPGIRPDLPSIASAVKKGALLTSEMELFLDLTPATVIGITGSDGKTTTTTLTGKLLEKVCEKRGRGRTYVGGNIGTPLLPLVEKMTAEDFAVVELSSFQLQTLRRSPCRSAITNLSKNHLDWHRDMEEYVEAKTNIYRHAQKGILVTNAENYRTCALAQEASGRVIWFSSTRQCVADFSDLLRAGDQALFVKEGWITLWDGDAERRILRADRILLPGVHNLENYMTAIGLTAPWITTDMADGIASVFPGVPHRLELVGTVGGVKYYNSSIDSTPSRTAAALSALRERPIVICGGYDKHIPFEPLADALCRRAQAVVLTGATAEKILDAIRACPDYDSASLPVEMEADFTEAIRRARAMAREGDTVLLSPACASFDMFKNFEERGELFRRTVKEFEDQLQ